MPTSIKFTGIKEAPTVFLAVKFKQAFKNKGEINL